ncbi:hypothetical protein KUCAC02_037491, partial [Chaenocephalus aceratus]
GMIGFSRGMIGFSRAIGRYKLGGGGGRGPLGETRLRQDKERRLGRRVLHHTSAEFTQTVLFCNSQKHRCVRWKLPVSAERGRRDSGPAVHQDGSSSSVIFNQQPDVRVVEEHLISSPTPLKVKWRPEPRRSPLTTTLSSESAGGGGSGAHRLHRSHIESVTSPTPPRAPEREHSSDCSTKPKSALRLDSCQIAP